MTQKVLDRLEEIGVIAIIRLSSTERIDDIVDALIEGGLSAIEVTMNTPGALGIISSLSKRIGDRATFGVGTVRSPSQAEEAILAGAEFVISPTVNLDTIKACKDNDIVVCPGAFSPTEIETAWEAGADIVKVFPTSVVGPSYIKAIKAPLSDVKLMPTGGVTVENAGEFIKNGASVIAVGSNLVNSKWIENREFNKITKKAKAYLRTVEEAREEMEKVLDNYSI